MNENNLIEIPKAENQGKDLEGYQRQIAQLE